MSRWRAVVFDLDDTLFAEHDYVRSGFRAVGAWASTALDVDGTSAGNELIALFDRGVRGDTFDRWLATHNLPATHRGAMLEAYRSHVPDIHPFPEVSVVLERLTRTHRLGLVSDGYADVQRRKLHALGIAGHFDAIVFSDDFGRASWKPSPVPFARVLALLDVKAAEAVYVGDNCAKDFIGARGAGLATIWARHSRGDYAVAEPVSVAYAADITIASLAELGSIVA